MLVLSLKDSYAQTAVLSDIVKMYVEKVKRKENGQLGDFDIAPDFKNGGVYRDVDLNTKRFEVVTDDDVPF